MDVNRLSLGFEWVEPGRARGAELRATWARLEVRVDGIAVTRAYSRSSDSVRDGVYLPLYPVAEGIAANWWALRFEVDAGRAARHARFEARHDLGRHMDGFIMPRLSVSAEPPAMRVRWGGRTRPGSPVDFIESGDRLLPQAEALDALRRFVDDVCARLADQGLAHTWLQDEWDAISGADEDETEFCRLVAAAGLDPYAADPSIADHLRRVLDGLPPSVHEDFLSIVDAADPGVRADALASDLQRARDARVRLPAECLAARTRAPRAIDPWTPWETGYRVARDLRARFGLADGPIPDLAGMGLPQGPEQDVAGGAGYDAAASAPDAASLGLVTHRQSLPGRRFAVARCLGDWILAPDGEYSAIITSAPTLRQRLSRAFAAEFLAPASAVRPMLVSDYALPEDLAELAHQFGVSDWVIRHQIENQLRDITLAA